MSHELRFKRAFDASPEEVFDAFVDDPEGLEEMYGADEPGWIVESQGEVKVGGEWSVAFGPSRDELYRFTHVFWVVDRPQRVAYATTETAPDGTILDLEVELTFEERNGKTLMTVVQRGFPSAELRDLHEVGQEEGFDRLASRVYARRSGLDAGRCRR